MLCKFVHYCISLCQRVKHSKIADGIDKAITEDRRYIPKDVDAEQVMLAIAYF